jgi:hypothetical protein
VSSLAAPGVVALFLWAPGCEPRPSFELAEGSYVLTMRLRMLKGGKVETDEEKSYLVEVRRRGDVVLIIDPARESEMITGRLRGNRFSATVADRAALVEMSGRLTADGVMEGDLVGVSRDGQGSIEGTWSLRPARRR